MLLIVSVVCLTNQSSSTKSERNMVIKRLKKIRYYRPTLFPTKLQVVLSSAFSPTHWLLATGCLSGRLAWHQPVIWSALTPVLLFVLWDSCFRLHVQILFVFITDSFCWQALPSSSSHHSYHLVLPSLHSTCSCHVFWPKWILTDISKDDSSTASALIC